MSTGKPSKPAFGKRGAPRRKALRLASDELVRTGPLEFPRLVRPQVDGLDLATWGAENRSWIDSRLARHGALLFRGFGIDSVDAFNRVIDGTSGGSLTYRERSSPRSQVGGNIYTSTDHPPEQEIYLHSEQSYNATFPVKIYFCCLVAAAEGGATPIADTRRVYERIDPEIRQRFLDQGYMYVRNFGDGLGLSWQDAFQTQDRAEVEANAHEHGLELEWKERGRLRTRQVRPAVARHPRTGELTWFNHATFFNASTLEPSLRQSLIEELGEEGLPNQTYYGDGSPIEPAVMAQLHAAYGGERRRFEWQEGDVLMLDNMLVAHGRDPFAGERRVVVGMADPLSWRGAAVSDAGLAPEEPAS